MFGVRSASVGPPRAAQPNVAYLQYRGKLGGESGKSGNSGKSGKSGKSGVSGKSGNGGNSRNIGKSERAGSSWSRSPIYVHLSQSRPHLLPLFPPFPASAVSYPASNPVGCWVLGRVGRVGRAGRAGRVGRVVRAGIAGRVERAGRNWTPTPIYVDVSQSLPTFPTFPVSVVSYPNPNPAGCWVLGRGEDWEERDEREERGE